MMRGDNLRGSVQGIRHDHGLESPLEIYLNLARRWKLDRTLASRLATEAIEQASVAYASIPRGKRETASLRELIDY